MREKIRTSLRATTPTNFPVLVTYAWLMPIIENKLCTFSMDVFSTNWNGDGSMLTLAASKLMESSISSFSQIFWSSGDMSITRSRGCKQNMCTIFTHLWSGLSKHLPVELFWKYSGLKWHRLRWRPIRSSPDRHQLEWHLAMWRIF